MSQEQKFSVSAGCWLSAGLIEVLPPSDSFFRLVTCEGRRSGTAFRCSAMCISELLETFYYTFRRMDTELWQVDCRFLVGLCESLRGTESSFCIMLTPFLTTHPHSQSWMWAFTTRWCSPLLVMSVFTSSVFLYKARSLHFIPYRYRLFVFLAPTYLKM